MKKNFIFAATFLLSTVTLFYSSCKRENKFEGLTSQKMITANVPLTDSLELFKQLKCIARGIPSIVKNVSGFENKVQKAFNLASPSYFLSNRSIQNNCISFTDYSLNVFNNTSNGYDSTFFYKFTYDNCDWTVGLTCPDMDIVDTLLTHLIVPTDPYKKVQLPYYGYLMNGSNLDSVLLDDDDIENYYIWWVVADEQCGKLNKKGSEVCGNGFCEPWFGEKISNCADCAAVPDVVGKNLCVLGVITGTDKKKFSTSHPTKEYQEWHYKGKYEIYLHFSIENTALKATSMNVNNLPIEVGDLTSWGNSCDVKRSKLKNNGSTVTNRGVNREVLLSTPIVLWTDYGKNVDDIYLSVFEYDHLVGILRSYAPNFGTPFGIKSRNHCYTFNSANVGNTTPVNLPSGGSKSTEVGFIRHDISGSPSIFKGPVTVGSFTGDTLHYRMDGEMKLILGLK